MFRTEKMYIDILNYSPRTGFEALEDRAFHFLVARKAGFSKILRNLSGHDKSIHTVKKLKDCYQAICYSLKQYKERTGANDKQPILN